MVEVDLLWWFIFQYGHVTIVKCNSGLLWGLRVQMHVWTVLMAMLNKSKPRLPGRKHVMLSGRFNQRKIVKYIKDVQSGLEAQGIKTFMVDCEFGESFAEPTMLGMYNAYAMVVFGTAEYGAKTGAGYETYHELQFAHQNQLPLIPVQLCDTWPPKPRDSDGGTAGAAQNAFVLKPTVIRVVDKAMQEPFRVASEIAAKFLKEVRESS